MMQKRKIAIGLGSNLGDRLAYLDSATQRLSEEFLENIQVSSTYETLPLGDQSQQTFLNRVVIGLSEWKPSAIVNFLKNLERELGRIHRTPWGDREIDLDLLIFAEESVTADGVTVPHLGIPERDFVLVPLIELWPDWKHPVNRKTPSQMYSELPKAQNRIIKKLPN